MRLEIEAALARNVRLIPVLVDGARMPSAADLPASLQGLARRQALELSPANFDTSRLLTVLETILTGATASSNRQKTMSDVEVKFNNYDSTQVGSQVAKADEVTVYMGASPQPAGADSDQAPDSGDEPGAGAGSPSTPRRFPKRL